VSFNGSGTFQINSSGQPVVTGTVISSTAFNALTADLATGLSTCVTKDGQTTTTARILFAQGISSTLTTDATSATTGSIITAGGISTQKALWVGTTSRHVGAATFDSTIASGAITSSGIVSGSQLRLDNATFTRVATPDGGGGFAGGYNVTYSSGVKHDSTGAAAGFYYSSSTGVTLYAAASQSAGTALTPVATFAQGGAATFVSSVTATSYITSSDYRLKENVQPMIGSLDKISSLKPVTYDWISDGSSAGGFIAHELQEVMPNAVVGEKDAVDDKGEIKPQGIDFGKVLPHLVAAIQELTTRLAALENK